MRKPRSLFVYDEPSMVCSPRVLKRVPWFETIRRLGVVTNVQGDRTTYVTYTIDQDQVLKQRSGQDVYQSCQWWRCWASLQFQILQKWEVYKYADSVSKAISSLSFCFFRLVQAWKSLKATSKKSWVSTLKKQVVVGLKKSKNSKKKLKNAAQLTSSMPQFMSHFTMIHT